jgi:hypothetical protein
MTPTVPIVLTAHSQYDLSFLSTKESGCGNCVVDWNAAKTISDLSDAINADPYRQWAFLRNLPYFGNSLQLSTVNDGTRIELRFPEPSFPDESKIFQLCHYLMDAKCAIYAYVGLDKDPQEGIQTQAYQFFATVTKIVAKVDRGNSWHDVGVNATKGANILMASKDAAKDGRDPEVMKATSDALHLMLDGLNTTMSGFKEIEGQLVETAKAVNMVVFTTECIESITLTCSSFQVLSKLVV